MNEGEWTHQHNQLLFQKVVLIWRLLLASIYNSYPDHLDSDELGTSKQI